MNATPNHNHDAHELDRRVAGINAVAAAESARAMAAGAPPLDADTVRKVAAILRAAAPADIDPYVAAAPFWEISCSECGDGHYLEIAENVFGCNRCDNMTNGQDFHGEYGEFIAVLNGILGFVHEDDCVECAAGNANGHDYVKPADDDTMELA